MAGMRARACKGCKNGKWTGEQSEDQGGHTAKTGQKISSKVVCAGSSGHAARGFTASARLDSPETWQEAATADSGAAEA